MKVLYWLIVAALLACSLTFQLKFPGVKIPVYTIKQAQRAHLYLAEQLSLFSRNRMSKYNLYLAVQNYKEVLDNLKAIVLQQIINYVIGSRNIVLGQGNIVLGSNNKLAGYNNWILTQKQVTSSAIQTNILYFQKWRIRLNDIAYIQYKPEDVISNLDHEDYQQLKKFKGIKDIKRFRKYRKGKKRQH